MTAKRVAASASLLLCTDMNRFPPLSFHCFLYENVCRSMSAIFQVADYARHASVCIILLSLAQQGTICPSLRPCLPSLSSKPQQQCRGLINLLRQATNLSTRYQFLPILLRFVTSTKRVLFKLFC